MSKQLRKAERQQLLERIGKTLAVLERAAPRTAEIPRWWGDELHLPPKINESYATGYAIAMLKDMRRLLEPAARPGSVIDQAQPDQAMVPRG
jgi:hypothetical protein